MRTRSRAIVIIMVTFAGILMACGVLMTALLVQAVADDMEQDRGFFAANAQPIQVIIEECPGAEEKTVDTKDEDDLIARVVMAEAGSEPFVGKVAVARVILNRAEIFDQTIEEVIYAKNQFAAPSKGIIVSECYDAVAFAREHPELFPDNMIYFRTEKYHSFAEDYTPIGNHYFSLKK